MTLFEKINELEGGTLDFTKFTEEYCPYDFVDLKNYYNKEKLDRICKTCNCDICWNLECIENSNNYTAEEIIKAAAMIKNFCDEQVRCSTCPFVRIRCGATECILNSSIPSAWELISSD